ncbi:MAG TPA: hypothetical protein VGJ26_00070 [Pirellulales bacterium]|jgi:hypothetical protein
MSSFASSSAAAYAHTQRAPLGWLLFGIGGISIVTIVAFWNDPIAVGASLTIGLTFALLGASLQWLAVIDAGDRLKIRFGPLPLFSRNVRYSDIKTVETGRTTIFEGWGVHLSLRGGWVWNIWGRNCVVIRSRRGVLRLGTDDPSNLASFLRRRAGLRGD